MNQAMGLTYDNLQLLRKSKSKSKSKNNSISSEKSQQIFSLIDSKKIKQPNNLNTKPTSKIERAHSTSQLSMLEKILGSK